MIYNLDGLFGISFSISQALRTLMGEIIALIFSLIEYLYSVFIYLSKAQILENEFIQSIYSKVGMILGIFMVFKLVFSLIQSLLDPNKFTDKKNGFAAIIGRCVISIVLLGVTPSIFKEAFKLQNMIVGGETSDNVIYKLIAGKSTVGSLDNMGRVIASDLYFSFFTDNQEPFLNHGVEDEIPTDIYEDTSSSDAQYYDRFVTDNYENLVASVKSDNKTFHDTVSYLAIKKESTGQYVIEFNWLLLVIVGCFVVWILAMYCVQVAIRVVQLAYLQLIAPVPILSYITDPDGTFKKWINQCVSTFLDLFLRLAIIYFIMTLIGDVLNQFTKVSGVIFESTGISSSNWFTLAIVKIFIIIGLLLFAQKVPQLLKDLFPNLGGGAGKFSFGLNPKKEVFEPLKKMYNSTPLGWAPKALGWAGKKTIGAIDRKVHNLPKPRNKVQQYFDKLAPGYADAAKYAEEKRKFDNSMKNGKALSDQLGDVKLDGNSTVDDFTKFGFNADYANAYINHERATDNVNKISAALEEARTRGDAARVGELTTELGKAQSTQTKMKKALEYQEGQHKRDATRMADYKLYCSRTKTVESWENSSSSSNQNEPSQNFDSASVVNRVNNITGVDRSPASENGAPTAENSLLAQLAEQAHQQEMQQEFMNRGNNNSPTSAPTDGNSYDSSDNYRYASQEQWDERIEFATEKMQELATNGSSQEEIDAQLKVLENLQNGKKQSLQKDHVVSDHLDDFYDRQNDGFGGQ